MTLGLSDDEAGPGHTHPDRLGQMLAVWSVSPRPESLTCSAIARCHGHRGHWPLLPPAWNPPLCVPFPARCQPGGGGVAGPWLGCLAEGLQAPGMSQNTLAC